MLHVVPAKEAHMTRLSVASPRFYRSHPQPGSTRRRFMAAGAALATGALAAACGATGDTPQAANLSKGPQKVVFYSVFASGEPWERYQGFWTNFTKENPNLQVELRPGTGNYQT